MIAEKLTVPEYLEFEKASPERHEYVDGVLIPMPGASRRHGHIVLNIIETLRPKARAKGCELQAVDIKTRTQDRRFRYPDILVSCAINEDTYVLEQPCLLIEVTSESTEHTDRGAKVSEYLRIASLECYAIIGQEKPEVTVYYRDQHGWRVDIFENTGAFLIGCLETKLDLAQIYADVDF